MGVSAAKGDVKLNYQNDQDGAFQTFWHSGLLALVLQFLFYVI